MEASLEEEDHLAEAQEEDAFKKVKKMEEIKKTEYGYEYQFEEMKIIITEENVTDNLVEYGKQLVNFYKEKKVEIENALFRKFERDEWYINELSREQILEKVGTPTIYVEAEGLASFSYLESKLDEHIITVELYKGFQVGDVVIDG